MAFLPYGAWTPDATDFESQKTNLAQNVLARGDGYGPFPDFAAATQALPGACRGAFYAINADGTVTIFAGTATKLYVLNNTSFTWTDVSLGGGSYSAVAGNAHWQFAQTGNFVFATQQNAPLQVFTLNSSVAFRNALGSPPQASYISVVGRFLVLSGLLSQPYRVQWSGLNNFDAATSWDNVTLQSNFQDFPDGGVVRGVAGGEFGTIFQDNAIRRMSYIAGSSYIFQIERVTQDMGLLAPYSIVRAGSTIFFLAGQGFYKIDAGSLPIQIGRERIDRTFIKDWDTSNVQLMLGASDPRGTRVFWAYKSQGGSAALYDKILCYDTALDRWTTVNMSGEFLVGISQPGATLESLDMVASTPLTITGAANNGSGAIRLTLSAETAGNPPYNGYTLLGQPSITVYGVVGTVEANGVWAITVIDATHIDLIGSTFTNAYVSGGSIGGSVDALTLSLDAYPTSVQPRIGQFNPDHKLGYFIGPNLEAVLEGAEQGTEENKVWVRGFRPITDAQTFFGSDSYRENLLAPATPGAEVAVNTRTGRCDMRRDTRYTRFKVRVPYGATWTYCAGLIPDITTSGQL